MKFLYIPCPNNETASQLANIIITKKLAFCANIYPGVSSIYVWDAELQTDSETILILKTFAELETEVLNEIKIHHPYRTPAIMSLQASSLNPEYSLWAREQTALKS